MDYKFEYEGDVGTLYLTTHLNTHHVITCNKLSDEFFRIGGTALSDLSMQKVIIDDKEKFIVEYYDINMETSQPKLLILDHQPTNINLLFINIDIIDGGGNIMRRYRVDPWFGDYKEINLWS